jgi:hypothetical protein
VGQVGESAVIGDVENGVIRRGEPGSGVFESCCINNKAKVFLFRVFFSLVHQQMFAARHTILRIE